MNDQTTRLLEITSLAKEYCELCETASEYTKQEFLDSSLNLLPRIYWHFFDLSAGVSLSESDITSGYVDQEMYDSVKGRISAVMGGSDTFLETFEEDMKYSETPIAATISECMADLYEPLFNFVSIVHDSEGAQLEEAFIDCKGEFENYWSQTLCNVLRALNNVKYNNNEEDYD